MRRWFILSCLLSGIFNLVYPQSDITGKVTDDFGSPLAGANVIIENTYQGAVSDINGRFIIQNVKHGTYILKVSYVGYNSGSKIVNVESNTEIDFILTKSNIIAEEVMISGTRVGGSSPITYTNVSKEDIRNLNFGQDIPQILSFTPSMVTTSDAGTGIGYTSFRIRGTDLNRINITMNGIPLNDAESHGVWWVDLPDFAGSVDNVQIQRGVGTSVNGAGAFGATMNFQTFTMNWRPYAEINSSFGSYNTLKNTIRIGSGVLGGRFTFDLRLSGLTSDGFIDRAFSDLKSFHLQGGYYTGKTMLKLNIFSGKEKTGQAWIGVPSALLSSNRRFNPAGMVISETGDTSWYENETDNYQQDHFQLILSNELSPELFFNAAFHYTRGNGYYEEYRQNQSFLEYRMESPVIGNDTIHFTDLVRRKWMDNDFYGLIWSFNCREDKVDSYLGGGINRYDGRHFGRVIWASYTGGNDIDHEWYRGTGIKTDGNIYFKLNYQVTSNFLFYGDIQYRFIRYQLRGIHEDLRDITQDKIYNFINPKFGLNYDFNSNHSVFFSFAVANREPIRSNFVDADTLHPAPGHETLYDYEAGYKTDLNRMYFHLNLYYMDYRDQLVLTGEINTVGAPIMTNVPASYRAGIEAETGIHPMHRLHWDLNVTLSRNKIKGFTEYVDNWDYWADPDNQPYQFSRELGERDLSFSPSLVAGSRITYEIINDLNIILQSKYVGKQYIDNTSSEDRIIENYFVNDLTIRYNFKTRLVKEIGVNLQVNNLFNTDYETNAWIYRYYQGGDEYYTDGYFPQAGIHFFGGLTLKF